MKIDVRINRNRLAGRGYEPKNPKQTKKIVRVNRSNEKKTGRGVYRRTTTTLLSNADVREVGNRLKIYSDYFRRRSAGRICRLFHCARRSTLSYFFPSFSALIFPPAFAPLPPTTPCVHFLSHSPGPSCILHRRYAESNANKKGRDDSGAARATRTFWPPRFTFALLSFLRSNNKR